MTVIHAASFPQSLSDICHPVTQRQRSEGSQASGRMWISEHRITDYQSTDHGSPITGHRLPPHLSRFALNGRSCRPKNPPLAPPGRGTSYHQSINPSTDHRPTGYRLTGSPIHEHYGTPPGFKIFVLEPYSSIMEPLRGSI
jgi:hypothetical protein